MSDILIKGIEMPFCCLVCPCSCTDNTEDGNEVWVCEASELRQLTTEDKIERRPEWCPLVSVPPHGDLIDRDALINDMANMIPWAIESPEEIAMVDGLSAGYEAVKDAPTIIPAEEGET